MTTARAGSVEPGQQRGRHNHGTEKARHLFREVDSPDGTVPRLDPATAEGLTDETQVRMVIGELKNDDQVLQHEGEGLLRLAGPVSEAPNVSITALVETILGPVVATKPPDDGPPPSDGS